MGALGDALLTKSSKSSSELASSYHAMRAYVWPRGTVLRRLPVAARAAWLRVQACWKKMIRAVYSVIQNSHSMDVACYALFIYRLFLGNWFRRVSGPLTLDRAALRA